jgi:hypothetical protein
MTIPKCVMPFKKIHNKGWVPVFTAIAGIKDKENLITQGDISGISHLT